MYSDDSGTIIERADCKLQLIYIADLTPLVSFCHVNFIILNYLIWVERVALDEQILVILPLNLPLVVIFVLDCDCMRVFLVFASVCILIHPFPIIFRESVKVDPYCSRMIGYYSLWSVQVNWNFIILVLNVSKSGCRVAIAIKIIILLLTEKGLVILMLEEFSFDSKPAIGVSNKFIFVLNGCYHLEVEIG